MDRFLKTHASVAASRRIKSPVSSSMHAFSGPHGFQSFSVGSLDFQPPCNTFSARVPLIFSVWTACHAVFQGDQRSMP
jgi:hypothetical protein